MNRAISRISIDLLLAAALAASAFGADIADYQKRISTARSGIDVLLNNASQREIGERPSQPDPEVFAEVRKLIPGSETVETPAGTVETNNQWFAEGLMLAETETDPVKRAAILSELDQRLMSVASELDELQTTTAAERSKDEDKQKLADILNRPEYQRPVREEKDKSSEGSGLIAKFLEWLEGMLPKFSPPEGTAEGTTAVFGVLQWVLIIAVLFVLGFVLYKLLPLFAPRFRRVMSEEREERVILGERIADDQSAQDLFGEAERLAREGDVRGAIRKGYVAFLCELSDRKLIGLARHKTNRDYLRDLRSRREIYESMNGLTGKFERHWYGSQEARPSDWEEFRQTCGETLKAI